MKTSGAFCATLGLSLWLLASCGGGGGGGASSGGPEGGGAAGPAPRLALFSTPQAVSGAEVIADFTLVQACPTCVSSPAIGVFGPSSVNGTVTANELDIGPYLSLDANDFVREYGLYDIYESSERVDTGVTVGGVRIYNTIDISASVLRSGEAGAAFDYASYAYWSYSTSLSASFPPTTGYTSFGIQPGDIPGGGGAVYNGVWGAHLLSGAPNATADSDRAYMSGSAALNANFLDKSMTGTLTVDPSSVTGGESLSAFSISAIGIDARFDSGAIVGTASTDMTYGGAAVSMEGDVSGLFYGPSAAETAGVFKMGTESGSLNMMGAFAAKQ